MTTVVSDRRAAAVPHRPAQFRYAAVFVIVLVTVVFEILVPTPTGPARSASRWSVERLR